MQAGWYFTPINHHLVGPGDRLHRRRLRGEGADRRRPLRRGVHGRREGDRPAGRPPVLDRRDRRVPPLRRADRRPADDAAGGPHGRRADALHVGHHRQAEGRAPHAHPGRSRRGRAPHRVPADALRHPAARRQRAHLRLAALPHGRPALLVLVDPPGPPGRADGQVDAGVDAAADPGPQGDPQPHGPDAVPPAPVAARGRAGELRHVVAAPHDPRGRAVPARDQAADDRVVGQRDRRVLRGHRGRRHARDRRAVDGQAGHGRPAVADERDPHLRRRRRGRADRRHRHRLHAHGRRRVRVLQGQGRRPRRTGGPGSSPSATSATSTRTATCSSATARPT